MNMNTFGKWSIDKLIHHNVWYSISNLWLYQFHLESLTWMPKFIQLV